LSLVRVAVVHNLPLGGARRRLASQLDHLDEDIVEVCLETALPVTSEPIVVPFAPLAPKRSKAIRPPFRYRDLLMLLRAWRKAAAHIRSTGSDVVYLNPCRYLQAPPVLLEEIPPTLYFCDEPRRVDAEPGARSTRRSLTRPVYAPVNATERRLDLAATRRAHELATNSRYTAVQIDRVYGRAATVVTMGVADSLMAPRATPDVQPYLLTVGALIPSKGHDLVVEAAARTSRPVTVVAPGHDPGEQARLERLAARLGVPLDVHVGISDTALSELYAGAHATVYLAKREPFGLVSLEAQACGCPVIVAAEGGLPETIIDGVTGWQTERDGAAAAAAIERLADRAVRDKMGAAARAHARNWSWAASAAEVGELLRATRLRRPLAHR
jgi:glycosyltransferase involved in cell wall biosynthesis